MRTPPKIAVRTMAGIRSRQRNWNGRNTSLAGRLGGLAQGVFQIMRSRIWVLSLLFVGLAGQPASAQGLLGGILSNVGSSVSNLTSPQPGVIVRTNQGLAGLKLTCLLHGC